MSNKDLVSRISKMGQSEDKTHFWKLLSYLVSDNANVRRTACNALGRLGLKMAEPALRGMLWDEKPMVRQYALKALRNCGSQASLSAVKMILKNSEEKDYVVKAAEITWKILQRKEKQILKQVPAKGRIQQDDEGGRPIDKLRKISLQNARIDLPLSPDQRRLLENLVSWLRNSNDQCITVGGYAGTGKTTLIGVLRQVIKQSSPEARVAFACYTGKAGQVLMNKLQEAGAIFKGDKAGTIHSLMYEPEVDKQGRVVKWVKNKEIKQDLIIIDEASMVDERIWKDLLSYGIRIIAVGDHGQLPPIEGKFNLMNSPKLRLEKIHRQADGNPILKMATWARERGKIPIGDFGPVVRKIKRASLEAQELCEEVFNSVGDDTLVLCGYNRTRLKLNQAILSRKERISPAPESGDRVICVRNIYDAMKKL